MISVKQILLDAAERLETHGWTQGVSQDKDGRCCAVGAISAVIYKNYDNFLGYTTNPKHHTAIIQEVFKPIHAILGEYMIIPWNDTPGRTADEVIAMIRKAAESVE